MVNTNKDLDGMLRRTEEDEFLNDEMNDLDEFIRTDDGDSDSLSLEHVALLK